jgi:hypothetical protein
MVKDVSLVFLVLVQRAFGHAKLPGDDGDGIGLIAVPREQAECRPQYILFGV